MPDPARLAGDGGVRVLLLGLPYDDSSSFLRGAAEGPPAIRTALFSPARSLCTESGLDLEQDDRFEDAGDLDLGPREEGLREIERQVARILEAGDRVLAVGGDHAVSWPLLRAHAARHSGLTVVQIDAHPDLYDELEGSRISHACPFARVMEEGLVRRLVQVGIRAATPPLYEQAERFGVEILPMAEWDPAFADDLEGPLYLSFDLDGLDPSCAPGVAHHEPGGLTTRQALEAIARLPGPLVGADVVELNPRRDLHGVTAVVAAKLVKEIAARMLEG